MVLFTTRLERNSSDSWCRISTGGLVTWFFWWYCELQIERAAKRFAYVNREVQQASHPFHCDSGVIFGHYSDVLRERKNKNLQYNYNQ